MRACVRAFKSGGMRTADKVWLIRSISVVVIVVSLSLVLLRKVLTESAFDVKLNINGKIIHVSSKVSDWPSGSAIDEPTGVVPSDKSPWVDPSGEDTDEQGIEPYGSKEDLDEHDIEPYGTEEHVETPIDDYHVVNETLQQTVDETPSVLPEAFNEELQAQQEMLNEVMASHDNPNVPLCHDWDDPELGRRFVSECSFYLKDLQSWEDEANASEWQIHAWQQASGAADRLAGLVSAFHGAARTKKKFDVHWEDIDAVFQPSCYLKNIMSIPKSKTLAPPKNACTRNSCKVAWGVKKDGNGELCVNSDTHLLDPLFEIRGCLTEDRCKGIKNWNGGTANLANSVGCPLRLMFEPRPDFLDHPVSFFMDGKIHDSSLRELVKLTKQFKTIALHYRAGDEVLVEHGKQKKVGNKWIDSNECMELVDKYVNFHGAEKGDNRPVKWIIASDDPGVRHFMENKHPDKVIMLMAPPEHLDLGKLKDHRQSTINVFSEWYLLSQADELVANKVKWAPISGFSKFARLYSLNTQYFAITHKTYGKCVRLEIESGGNIDFDRSKKSTTGFSSPSCKPNFKFSDWKKNMPFLP